jgi:hypothetical protein
MGMDGASSSSSSAGGAVGCCVAGVHGGSEGQSSGRQGGIDGQAGQGGHSAAQTWVWPVSVEEGSGVEAEKAESAERKIMSEMKDGDPLVGGPHRCPPTGQDQASSRAGDAASRSEQG